MEWETDERMRSSSDCVVLEASFENKGGREKERKEDLRRKEGRRKEDLRRKEGRKEEKRINERMNEERITDE